MRSQFARYALIGATGLSIDIALFALLHEVWAVDKQLASFVSISVAIANNFVLNVRYNFRVTDRLLARFVSFYLVGASGIVITAALLWVLVDVAGTGAMAAKLISLPVVLVTQFTLNKLISFRSNESDQPIPGATT